MEMLLLADCWLNFLKATRGSLYSWDLKRVYYGDELKSKVEELLTFYNEEDIELDD